jgi:hypothetical protein
MDREIEWTEWTQWTYWTKTRGQQNPGSSAVGALKRGLDSKNPKIRAWCLWQLRRIVPETEIDVKRFIRDPDAAVRANAAMYWGEAGKKGDAIFEVVRKLRR